MHNVELLVNIFAENRRLMDNAPKGTREVPAIVDPSKTKKIEMYAGRHLHDLDNKCIKNVWWPEDGFCK